MTNFEEYIGSFQLHAEVGHSPITHKYRATNGQNSQTVALYILNADVAQDPATKERFLAIGRQAMRLQHANLIRVLDVGESSGFVYIATQWVREQSLGERLRRSGRTIDIETAVYIIKGVAAALDYAHSEGFVHGHITPDQVYVTNDNTVLLDGFAEAVRVDDITQTLATENAAETETQPLIFFSPFLAPEQAQASPGFGFRSDIYSLGAVLYTMITGRPLFEAEDPIELRRQLVGKQPLSPELINPALPAAIVYVLQAVLDKNPTKRYGSASEFANAFQQSSRWNVITTTELVTTKPERIAIRVESAPNRNRRRSFAAILLLLIVVALGFVISSTAGFGPLGNRLALSPQLGQPNVIDRLRSFWSPASELSVELTANPMALTPAAGATLTPPTPTLASAPNTQVPAVAAALGVSVTNDSSATVLTDTITASNPFTPSTSTAVETPIPPTSTATTTPPATSAQTRTGTVVAANIASTTANTPTLALDPLGLLTGAVTAGQVVVTGNAAPGAQIQLKVNGNNIGNTITKSTGTWLIIVNLAEPNDYVIVAQQVDATGAVMETAQRTITVTRQEERDKRTPSTAALTTRVATVAAVVATTTMTNAVATTMGSTAAATPTQSTTATPMATVVATVTPTVQPTTTVPPTLTQTRTPKPTATVPPTPKPSATSTNTPKLTATIINTATNTPKPTATRTPVPTATATNTSVPTATNTPLPTATRTLVPTATATNTPLPTATNTPLPTATRTPVPTATATNTPLPTATNTPLPTATLPPTATNTPVPTATNTPLPTATNTPVPPTATNTRPPTVTNTPTPAVGSIAPVSPSDGDSANGGQRTFTWSADFTPSAGYAFELVFWKPGQNPLVNSIGMAAPTTNLNVTLELERLDEQLGALFDTGEYNWGVLLVRTAPAYERVQYLGGGRRFIYYRGSEGGDPGSGDQSSGE